MAQSSARQMSLVGFMQAGNTTVYAGSWRHPATEHGFLDQRYYQKLGRILEDGCFDMMFFDDRLAMPGIYGGSVAEAVRRGARPVKLDLSIVLGLVAGATQLDRARRHLLDDLLLAVPRRPHLRHARPPHRRPRRVERGHVGERQRGAELRRRAPPRPRRALRPGRRVPRGHHRACGTRGRTTPSCSTARAAVFADPDKVHELKYEGEWFKRAGSAHRAPLAPGPARCCSRPDRRAAAATSRPRGRSSSSPATRASTSPASHYKDQKERIGELGRDPDTVRMLPMAYTVVGESRAHAEEREQLFLNELVAPDGVAHPPVRADELRLLRHGARRRRSPTS